MLIRVQLLNDLKDLGLNSYESKLWTALLSRGVATAGELSDIAHVPRSRSYDVLESLERKGFIITKLGKPIKYIAVSPEHVIDRLHKDIVAETQIKEESLQKLEQSDVLEELTDLHKTGIKKVDSFELSGTLKGRKNIYSHLNHLIKNASYSVTILTTADGVKRKKEHLHAAMKTAAERGVKIIIQAPFTPGNKAALKELSQIAKIQDTPYSTRAVFVDGREAVIMVTDDKENPVYDTGIWINSDFFAGGFDEIMKSVKTE